MATKNLVPRATDEGQLGTSNKKWQHVYAVQGNFNKLKNASGSDIFRSGDEATLTIALDGDANQYVLDEQSQIAPE